MFAKGGCPFSNNVNGVEEKSDHPSSAHRIKRSDDDVADQATTTTKGCTCKSKCGATMDDGYKFDWCYTGTRKMVFVEIRIRPYLTSLNV